MLRVKMVKDYQPSRDYLVLSLVKKYPLYSLNKIHQKLPGVSRHSIQLILEKNDLSTIENRVAYASEKGNPKVSLGAFRFNFRLILSTFLGLLKKPELRGTKVVKFCAVFVFLITFWLALTFIFGSTPTIVLDEPQSGYVNEGEKLFVAGRVRPVSSKVKVNGQEVLLNGDGTFSAIVNIPVEESTLEVTANHGLKMAKLVRLVSRKLTQEELAEKAEEETKKKKEETDRLVNLDRTVNDLLAVKNASPDQKKNLVKIINSHIQEESGFSQAVGEVTNLGQEEVSWVMITANFFDQSGGVVDKKYGFATSFGQVLKPNETAKFETQATAKQFSSYSLELEWQEAAVAGVSTEGNSATPSGQPIP